MQRRSLIIIAAAVTVAGASGIAYAAIPGSDGSVQGCYTKIGGILRVVDSPSKCQSFEVPISWSQKGPKGDPGLNGINGAPGAPGTNGTNGTNGADGADGADGAPGISPTVAQLVSGDPNCPAGGAAITDAAGHTAYVCSGQAGADGQSFSGSFTSPNGQYSINVTDTGITLRRAGGPNITLQNDDILLRSTAALTLQSGTDMSMRAGTNFDARAGLAMTMLAGSNASLQAGIVASVSGGAKAEVTSDGIATVHGSITDVNGNILLLNNNGTCLPAARLGDAVTGVSTGNPGAVIASVVSGSPTVCIGG